MNSRNNFEDEEEEDDAHGWGEEDDDEEGLLCFVVAFLPESLICDGAAIEKARA